MRFFTKSIEKLSTQMDKVAGFCVMGVMVLVVSNILLRKIFKQPILGTYELVGYITALAVSLSLANCAFQKGHIALDYIVNKFPDKVRNSTNLALNFISLCFWSLSTWHLAKYAHILFSNGVVSPTAQMPVYPIVLLIGLGLVGLSLVILIRFIESVLTSVVHISLFFKNPYHSGAMEYVRKAVR